MKIIYRTGDMFAGPELVVIHGCNAKGVMGSGVARVVRDTYPGAYAAYRSAFEERGLMLGEVIWAVQRGRIIGNAITQQSYGREPGQVYVSYDAIRTALRAIDRITAEPDAFPQLTKASGGRDVTDLPDEAHLASIMARVDPIGVALPLLGAGLGGGSWPVIAEIIETESHHFQPVVYTLDGTVPAR